MSKKENYITIVLFFAFICAFSIAFWIVPDKAFSDNENRYLKEVPSVSGEKIVSGEFMEDWEDYVSDQFPARDAFMELGVRYKYTLGIRDFNGVFIAQEGYLLSVMDRNSIASDRVNINITSLNLFLDKCEANENINNEVEQNIETTSNTNQIFDLIQSIQSKLNNENNINEKDMNIIQETKDNRPNNT